MERRHVAGFEVSVLGLGTSRLASMGAGRSKADAKTLLGVARDCGVNFIDTADTYGSTAAERWVGDLTHADGHPWVVATKTGLPTVDLPGPFRIFNQPAKKIAQKRRGPGFALEPASLARGIERSLRRLRRDRIEVFLLHLPPAGIVNDDETHDILRDVQRRGLVAAFGVSSDDVATIRDVHEQWGCTSAETAVNPWNRSQRSADVFDGLEIIANHVMGSPSNREALTLQEGALASPHPASGLSRRLLRHAAAVPGVKVVLTGTANPEHLRENARSFETPVSDHDLLR